MSGTSAGQSPFVWGGPLSRFVLHLANRLIVERETRRRLLFIRPLTAAGPGAARHAMNERGGTKKQGTRFIGPEPGRLASSALRLRHRPLLWLASLFAPQRNRVAQRLMLPIDRGASRVARRMLKSAVSHSSGLSLPSRGRFSCALGAAIGIATLSASA